MFNRDHPADEAGAPLYENVVPRVEALLAEYGASHPSELPHEVAAKILHSVLLKIVGPNCPTAALRLLIRAVRRCVRDISSFGHPAFFPAWERVRLSTRAPANAFAMATGPDAAVVLAGYGFPVAPFEFGVGVGVLVEPSNDIDEVLAIFSRWTHAIVGYRSCDAPFYVLVTDCVRTLRERILSRPELSEAKMLFNAVARLCHQTRARVSCLALLLWHASREIRFRVSVCMIRTLRRGRSRCTPGGRLTENHMAHRMMGTPPSRCSCFGRSSMTQPLGMRSRAPLLLLRPSNEW